MRDKHKSDILADLAYLANDLDAPAVIRTAASAALTAHAIAVKTASDYRTDHITAASDLDRITKRTANDLADDLIAGKAIAIDRAFDKITKLTDKRDRLNSYYSLSDSIASATRVRCGQILRDNYLDLILWCARKRAADVTRCGAALPDQVRRIWHALDVRWWPHYDRALSLNQFLYNGKLITLPIEWFSDWDEMTRASLAWIYSELAAGRYIIINQEQRHLIRLTEIVIDLPIVPKTIPLPKTNISTITQ